jgi:CDP-diacylglycerol--serine O-phosphatidyltransferase
MVRHWLIVFIPGFIAVALLMVSTVRFAKPQTIVLQKIQGFKLILLLLLCVALLVIFFNYIHFIAIGLLLLYVFSGLMSVVIQFIQDHKY